MKAHLKSWVLAAVAAAATGATAAADDAPAASAAGASPPSAPPQRSAADLEKLAMPVALHPDPLIAIILPASVYPVEIVQAARFVRDTNNIPKIDDQPWDANVKAVAKFPALIQKLDADLSWTVELGQAFLDQPKELMDTIQALRARAQKAGTLQTTPQQVVVVTNVVVMQANVIVQAAAPQIVCVTNTVVQIQPANPQVVYVPTYPPTVYYPPPAYVGPPPAVTFAAGVAVGAIIANNCNWYHGDIDIHVDRDIDIHSDVNVNRNANASANRDASLNRTSTASKTGQTTAATKWQPDQSRLRASGTPSTATSAQSREARGWGSTGPRPAQTPSGSASAVRPATTPSVDRPAASAQNMNRAAPSQAGDRPSPAPNVARPAQTPSVGRPASPPPSSQRESAFGGVNSGADARNFSQRGSFSRTGGGTLGTRRR